MRTLAVILFTILTLNLWGQDSEMLDFINKYRVAHGKSTLNFNDKLADIAVKCNQNNILNDTLEHTKIAKTIATGEIIAKDKRLPATTEEKVLFGTFLKSIFGIVYTDPNTDCEVIKLTKLYLLYKYDQSKDHKKTLLGDFTQVGFDTVISGITKHSGPKPIVINGKVYERKNTLNYFEVSMFSAIDFN